jgi:chromosome segregation ATPase
MKQAEMIKKYEEDLAHAKSTVESLNSDCHVLIQENKRLLALGTENAELQHIVQDQKKKIKELELLNEATDDIDAITLQKQDFMKDLVDRYIVRSFVKSAEEERIAAECKELQEKLDQEEQLRYSAVARSDKYKEELEELKDEYKLLQSKYNICSKCIL